jgi:hypothetical protein
MPGGHNSVIRDWIRWDYQGVAVNTADIFLYVEIFKVGLHIFLVTVDAHFVLNLKQGLLAVGVVTIRAANICCVVTS